MLEFLKNRPFFYFLIVVLAALSLFIWYFIMNAYQEISDGRYRKFETGMHYTEVVSHISESDGLRFAFRRMKGETVWISELPVNDIGDETWVLYGDKFLKEHIVLDFTAGELNKISVDRAFWLP